MDTLRGVIAKNAAEALFRRASRQAEKRVAAAEAQVERWVWCKGVWYEHALLPFDRYRFLKLPTFHKSEPKQKGQGTQAFGFDGEGRVVLHRSYATPNAYVERASAYAKGGSEWTRYRRDGALLEAAVIQLGPHGITELRMWDWEEVGQHWKIRYEDGRPTTMMVEQAVPEEPLAKHELSAEWDDEGALVRIQRHDLVWDRRRVEWERPKARKRG